MCEGGGGIVGEVKVHIKVTRVPVVTGADITVEDSLVMEVDGVESLSDAGGYFVSNFNFGEDICGDLLYPEGEVGAWVHGWVLQDDLLADHHQVLVNVLNNFVSGNKGCTTKNGLRQMFNDIAMPGHSQIIPGE